MLLNSALISLFLSTPSARRATLHDFSEIYWLCEFLSTPSARRATDLLPNLTPEQKISIHALREEGDHFEPRHTI